VARGRIGANVADEQSKQFSLTEAERLRAEIEPLLIEAMEARRRMAELEKQLSGIAERIQRSGGMVVAYESAAKMRIERNRQEETVRTGIERIHATGCLVKDLDVGLLDFPSRLNNEDIYLCWKLGEDRIRFYHRQDEGFAGRKPLDPRDAGYSNPIQ
jgi:hypothetical protein